MYKFLPVLIITLALSGCATTGQVFDPNQETELSTHVVVAEQVEEVQDVRAPQVESYDAVVEEGLAEEIQDPLEEKDDIAAGTMETDDEAAERIGVVFAKTNFEGVLKTTFVRLKIVNQEFPERTYELHIGEKTAQLPFAFNVKTVNPGYFYIELPEGSYKFSAVSIPVGTATATEDIDISFNVIPDQVNYLGTLSINGTKERIKLGGVPVIRPGFEYEAAVFDEFDEGIQSFHQRFPNVSGSVTAELMSINQ